MLLLYAWLRVRCGHTLLLAHAKAVQLYRLKYQPQQEGRISLAISAHWGMPKNPRSAAGMAHRAFCQSLKPLSSVAQSACAAVLSVTHLAAGALAASIW
jgi:hypothetical protein